MIAKLGSGGASARATPLAGSSKASRLGVGKAGMGLRWGVVSSFAARPLGVACVVSSVWGVNSLPGILVVSGSGVHCPPVSLWCSGRPCKHEGSCMSVRGLMLRNPGQKEDSSPRASPREAL